MADWLNPQISSQYVSFLDYLKARDDDAAKLFDNTGTNLPVGTIRWSSANNRFEKFDGTNWVELTAQYSINVSSISGASLNDNGITASDLWSAAKILSELSLKANTSLNNVSDSTILSKIKNVDGAGSGLDADLLDGLSSTQFLRSDVEDTYTPGFLNLSNTSASISMDDQNAPDGRGIRRITCNDAGGNWNFRSDAYYKTGVGLSYARAGSGAASITHWTDFGDGKISLYVAPKSVNADDPVTWTGTFDVTTTGIFFNGNTVWHAGNDGAGSGLDADTLDGLDSTQFLRSDIENTYTPQFLNLSNGTASISMDDQTAPDGRGIRRITCNDGAGNWNFRSGAYYKTGVGLSYATAGSGAASITLNSDFGDGSIQFYVAPKSVNADDPVTWASRFDVATTGIFFNGNTVWHAGNDDSIQKAENELIGTVDFNTILKPGNYRVDTSGNTYTNTPENTFQGVLVVNSASPSTAYSVSTQMLFSYNTNKVYYRIMWGTGNWTAWKEVVEKGANWIPVTLLNGHTGDLFYCKIGSAVYLKGVVNTTNATSYTIGALPADVVPSYATTMFIQPLVYDSTAFARIQIASDGTINLPPSTFNVGSIAMNLNYITDQ